MRRVIFAIVGTVVGLTMLLSFKIRPAPSAASAAAGTNSSNDAGSTGTASTASGSTPNGTVTGSAASTRYGPVQVKVTVANGQLTDVTAVRYPTGSPRDAQINAYAIPQLNQEALAAKSAQIDMITGATYTSEGYINSLQSALNKAGLS